MVPHEERANLYIMVPSWWRNYEYCQSLLAPTSPLFLYVGSLFISGSVHTEALYRIACADHCVMGIRVFLQWANPSKKITEASFVGNDLRMLENVYKDVLHPLLDAVVRLATAAGVDTIVAETRYSLCLLMLQFFTLRKSTG